MDNTKNIKLYSFALLVIIFSNLFFGWSFQNITIGFVPLIHVLLLLLLLNSGFNKSFKILNELGLSGIFFIYLTYNFIKLLFSFNEYGIIALRDASFVIDSVFILVSLSFFSSNEVIISKILKICFFYCFFFIFFWYVKDSILFLSPKITSPGGSTTNLFFNFSTINITCGFFAFYSYLFLETKNKKLFFFIFFLIFSLILLPKRMIYLWYVSSFIYLYFIDKKNINLLFKLFIFIIFFYILDLTGVFSGIKIYNLSLFDFFENHLLSTIPSYDISGKDDLFRGTQSTIEWRIQTWSDTISNLTETFYSFLFGMPFGMPLTNLYVADGILTREPHNLYITTLARSGFIGFILFSVLHYKILKILYLTYKKTLKPQNKQLNNLMILFSLYVLFIFTGGGISSSILSVTYHSTQLYLFSGIWISIYFKILKNENLSNS
mgnify:CR=1 FL=1